VAEAAVLLADLGGAPYSILAPGASYGPAKRWSPGRYIALGRWLAAGGDRILVCGAGSERGTCEAVAAGIGPAARSLAGNTTLPAQAGLCARSRLAVCNDSGLAHLAAATGAPTIVIFGSTSSAWSAPLGPRVRVVQRAPVCSPCFARTCAIGYPCLEAVEVGMVEDAAREWAA
jgi:heptosyltransferase-2